MQLELSLNSAVKIWQRFTLTRYLAASVMALAVDTALFLLLIYAEMEAIIASAIGYCAGILVHWIISAQIVFPGKIRDGNALHVQRILFVGSALLGLSITVGVVALMTSFGSGALAAKIVAVGTSFVAVYAMRKWGVFK